VKPQLRRIQPSDAAVLRRVRLAALEDAPDAFGTTLAKAEALEAESWAGLAEARASGDKGATFFVEDNAAAWGMAAGVQSDHDPATADLISMWVTPSHRRRGVGLMLVDAVVAWARQGGYERVELWVTESNSAAAAIYVKAGFEATEVQQPLPSNPALPERLYRLKLAG
jgi:GNAT superfamily N-acetyltransferase